jgi:hypothetical protein
LISSTAKTQNKTKHNWIVLHFLTISGKHYFATYAYAALVHISLLTFTHPLQFQPLFPLPGTNARLSLPVISQQFNPTFSSQPRHFLHLYYFRDTYSLQEKSITMCSWSTFLVAYPF